nr:hypothetical protein [Nitrosomonas nitrosa]
MKVELIYDADCPNVQATRENLLKAFQLAGVKPHWVEWERSDADAPAYALGFGSPAVLINVRDLEDKPPLEAACCRIYAAGTPIAGGVPSVDLIVTGLKSGSNLLVRREKRPLGLLAAFPAVTIALLPKVACPACWPAYAGIVSALGLGFVLKTKYLLPLTVLFLFASLGSLAYKVKARGGLWPFFAGFIAAVMIVYGKFGIDSDVVVYSGVAILVCASLWKSWARIKSKIASCCNCTPVGTVQLSDAEFRKNYETKN